VPETPDFKQIAERLLQAFPHTDDLSRGTKREDPVVLIVAELRQVWNARGAADIIALERVIGKLGDTMDPDNARVFVANSIRTLDR